MALGGIVELGEAQPFARKGVEVGGLDFGSVTSEVGEAEVVGHDEDDVRGGAGGRSGRGIRHRDGEGRQRDGTKEYEGRVEELGHGNDGQGWGIESSEDPWNRWTRFVACKIEGHPG